MNTRIAKSCYWRKQPFTVVTGNSWPLDATPIVEVFAACLKHYMAERRLTQAALAAKSGVAQTTISLYMRPKARGDTASGRAGSPTLANIEALAAALGVEVWELLRQVNPAERDLFRAVLNLAESVQAKATKTKDH